MSPSPEPMFCSPPVDVVDTRVVDGDDAVTLAGLVQGGEVAAALRGCNGTNDGRGSPEARRAPTARTNHKRQTRRLLAGIGPLSPHRRAKIAATNADVHARMYG